MKAQDVKETVSKTKDSQRNNDLIEATIQGMALERMFVKEGRKHSLWKKRMRRKAKMVIINNKIRLFFGLRPKHNRYFVYLKQRG